MKNQSRFELTTNPVFLKLDSDNKEIQFVHIKILFLFSDDYLIKVRETLEVEYQIYFY